MQRSFNILTGLAIVTLIVFTVIDRVQIGNLREDITPTVAPATWVEVNDIPSSDGIYLELSKEDGKRTADLWVVDNGKKSQKLTSKNVRKSGDGLSITWDGKDIQVPAYPKGLGDFFCDQS